MFIDVFWVDARLFSVLVPPFFGSLGRDFLLSEHDFIITHKPKTKPLIVGSSQGFLLSKRNTTLRKEHRLNFNIPIIRGLAKVIEALEKCPLARRFCYAILVAVVVFPLRDVLIALINKIWL